MVLAASNKAPDPVSLGTSPLTWAALQGCRSKPDCLPSDSWDQRIYAWATLLLTREICSRLTGKGPSQLKCEDSSEGQEKTRNLFDTALPRSTL